MRSLSIETSIHGRVLVRDAAPSPRGMLVGFHGYKQSADDMLSDLERIPGSGAWTLVSIQGLHRFYANRHEKVVASWMTRQDRDDAIGDNLAYVNRALDAVVAGGAETPLVFVGFSQGVAMAYRAAVLGSHRPRCVIAIGGDVPPEIRDVPAERFPSVVIAAGQTDELYTAARLEQDEGFLRSHILNLQIIHYQGGHEWTDDLCVALQEILNQYA